MGATVFVPNGALILVAVRKAGRCFRDAQRKGVDEDSGGPLGKLPLPRQQVRAASDLPRCEPVS